MYSLKGSWAGKTFALATSNDSGGKKSRIRRSKEERKTMVESFIKRYQSSNNGNFPSLNLTHKEVGGSFYTVREIVREIIQENRILGPGQFGSEEQIDDTIAVNYPLGTISSEPQGTLIRNASEWNAFSIEQGKESVLLNLDINGQYAKHFDKDAVLYSTEHPEPQTDEIGEDVDEVASKSTSENLFISDHQEQANLEVPLNSNAKCFNVNQTNHVRYVNHMETNGISDKLIAEESPECDTLEAGGESEQMGAFQAELILPTEEVQVETFPLRPKETSNMSSTSTDLKNFDGTSDGFASNSTPVMDKVSSFDTSSDQVITKEADSSVVSGSGASADMMIQHAEVNHRVVEYREVNLKDNSVDMPNSLPIKGDTAVQHNLVKQLSPHVDSTSKIAEQNNLQTRPKNVLKAATYLENSSGTEKPTLEYGNDFKKDEKAMVGSSPPVDRIDLEWWTASKQERNPILAFFKAFADAFFRFWS